MSSPKKLLAVIKRSNVVIERSVQGHQFVFDGNYVTAYGENERQN